MSYWQLQPRKTGLTIAFWSTPHTHWCAHVLVPWERSREVMILKCTSWPAAHPDPFAGIQVFHVTGQSPAGAPRKRLAWSTGERKAIYILQHFREDAGRRVKAFRMHATAWGVPVLQSANMLRWWNCQSFKDKVHIFFKCCWHCAGWLSSFQFLHMVIVSLFSHCMLESRHVDNSSMLS